MRIFAKSRDGILYNASAMYDNGKVTVFKGSKINRRCSNGFKPKKDIAILREDNSLFNNNELLMKDITFDNLSSAATFVTGRVANGMIVWKTEDNKYIRYTIQKKEV